MLNHCPPYLKIALFGAAHIPTSQLSMEPINSIIASWDSLSWSYILSIHCALSFFIYVNSVPEIKTGHIRLFFMHALLFSVEIPSSVSCVGLKVIKVPKKNYITGQENLLFFGLRPFSWFKRTSWLAIGPVMMMMMMMVMMMMMMITTTIFTIIFTMIIITMITFGIIISTTIIVVINMVFFVHSLYWDHLKNELSHELFHPDMIVISQLDW